MTNFRLSQARTSLENLKKDISDVPTQVFLEWMNFIAIEIYHLLLGCDPSKFIVSPPYTALTGSQALPLDFDSLKYDGCGFFEVNEDGTQSDRRLIMTNFGSSDKGYYLDGDYVYFTGLPTNLSVTLRYIPEFPQFTDVDQFFTIGGTNTDPCIVPIGHLEVIVNGLDMFYCRWDENTSMEPSATQKYEASLMDLAGDYRRVPNAYSTQDFSSSY